MSDTTPTALAAESPAPTTPDTGAGEHPGDTSASPESNAILGEGGGFAPGWYQNDPRIADHGQILDRYAGPADLGQALVELNKMRPGPPVEGASDETRDAFRKWVGVPSQYELKPPEGKSYDENIVGAFTEVIQKHNGVINNDAMNELAQTLDAVTAEGARQAQIQKEQAIRDEFADLAKTFGNDWDNKREAAIHLMTTLGLDPTGDPRFGNNAAAVELAARFSEYVSEGRIEGIKADASARLQSAGTEADRMMNDPNHPDHEALLDTSHPRYKEVNARYMTLVAQRNRSIG